MVFSCFFFFSSRRRHTRYWRDWSSDVCSSDLLGKGGKYRDILIPKKLKNIWKDYMIVRKNNSDKLFTGREGGISRFTALNIVKKYGSMAKIKKDKVYNHAFRHLYCLNLVDRGISLDAIKDR